MKVLVSLLLADGSFSSPVEANALSYAFPKRGVAAADYFLVVNGERVGIEGVANTGFGTEKSPSYTYFRIGGKSYYLPKTLGALPKGSTITVAPADVPAAVPAAPKAPVEEAITVADLGTFEAPAEEFSIDFSSFAEAPVEAPAAPVEAPAEAPAKARRRAPIAA